MAQKPIPKREPTATAGMWTFEWSVLLMNSCNVLVKLDIEYKTHAVATQIRYPLDGVARKHA
jgi:hypothetical protein